MATNFNLKFSGVGNSAYADGQMLVDSLYVTNDADTDFSDLDSAPFYRDNNPILSSYNINNVDGIYKYPVFMTGHSINEYSFYRREYEEYCDGQTFIGPWEPVLIKTDIGHFRDFNISNGRSYQYIMYPYYASYAQVFANPVNGGKAYGEPIKVNWGCWSLIELIPENNSIDNQIIKKTYKADINNIWMFKYALEAGDEKQNITKNQVQTLGQYSRISHGLQNNVSGSVSCYLGSEIIPYTEGYIERMWQAKNTPLSTNEKTYMLKKWREIAYSKNPKLLKDMKGQSWIVQIIDSSNKTNNFYRNQPDTINFSWIEIAPVDGAIIYGDNIELPGASCGCRR